MILKILTVEGATMGNIGQAVVNIADNDSSQETDDSQELTHAEATESTHSETTDPVVPSRLSGNYLPEDSSWVLPNVSDDSGFALSIDKLGVFSSSKSTFKGGVSIEKDDFTTIRTVAPGQRFKVAAMIEVASTDRSKSADLLYVIGTEPPAPPPAVNGGYDGGVDTVYMTMNTHNNTTLIDLYADVDVWMAQFTEPFKPRVTLEREIPLVLWDGQLDLPGMYYFFVGYRLDDGMIVYVSRPIMVEVR